MDKGDNDPIRFWTYIIATLQGVLTDLGETALAALQSPQSPSIEHLLTDLINQLAALPERVILVLDDYHKRDRLPGHRALWLVCSTLHVVAVAYALVYNEPQTRVPDQGMCARQSASRKGRGDRWKR